MTIDVNERDLIQVLGSYPSKPNGEGKVFYRCPCVYYLNDEMRTLDMYSVSELERGFYLPSMVSRFVYVKAGNDFKSKQVNITRIGRKIK